MINLIKISSKEALATPSERVYTNNGVYAYKSLIPYTYTSAHEVYFVSGTNGDEFGQFDNKIDAIKRAEEMAKLPQEERTKEYYE